MDIRELWLEYLKNVHDLTEEQFKEKNSFEQYAIDSGFNEKYNIPFTRD